MHARSVLDLSGDRFAEEDDLGLECVVVAVLEQARWTFGHDKLVVARAFWERNLRKAAFRPQKQV